ncbi:MAG: EpsG family protein, partial [Anaeroplasmataceae bacterium]|nr:EpsG family protein [Anaeroplasmataceae bacterium]
MAVYLIGFSLTALFACISRLYYIQYDNQQIVCQNSLITTKSVEKWKNDSLVNYIFTAISVYGIYIYYKIYGKEQTVSEELLTTYRVVKDHKKIYIAFMALAILPLFLIAGLRYGVGTDYFYTYSPNFYKILMGESPYSEFGFNLLNRFIQLFTKKDTGLFLVTGFIFAFLLVKTIIKHSENVLLSLIVVLISCIYFVSLNNVRQSIVSVIMLAAYPYFVKKETIKLLICCLCGMIFHYIAVAIFLVYIVCYFKIIQKYFPIICLLCIVSIPVISIVLKEI